MVPKLRTMHLVYISHHRLGTWSLVKRRSFFLAQKDLVDIAVTRVHFILGSTMGGELASLSFIIIKIDVLFSIDIIHF